jgi:8-oxo-dGTP pyrophosphatase MutT (NUDIX family)
MSEWSAGGIVFWGRLVLVLTNFRGDTVFPKGHLERGEMPEQAALREVLEEAGIRPLLLCALGTTEYTVFSPKDRTHRQKTVYWFLMQADTDFIKCDGYEIIAGQYVPVEQAERMLTYDLDRAKLVLAYEELRRRLAKC